MPAVMTLLDIAKANASEGFAAVVDEAARATPEITGETVFRGQTVKVPQVGDSRTIKGTMYKTLIRTALPTAQFRHANEGVTPSVSTYENRTIECFILNCLWRCDRAVAMASEDGSDAVVAAEAKAVLQASLQHLATQFYYGILTPGDPKGFPGLLSQIDATMVVDATGAAANTGTSVVAVDFGPDSVQWVFGQEGKLDVTELAAQLMPDPDTVNNPGKFLTYLVQEMLCYVGLQMKHKFAAARVKNLTAEAGKTLTDDILADLVMRAPAGKPFDVLFMTRRSLRQLQDSRTATNATGAPAPFPQEYEGIPILVTDNLLDTEAIA